MQIVPLLLKSSVNAVGAGDKKWNDQHMERVEGVSIIAAAFISARRLKMIRDPKAELIVQDWVPITRV